MNVYEYVASSNPNKAMNIVNSFGYEITNRSDLGRSLRELVANVGEPALVKVLENHPDKDVILEVFSKTEKKESGCGCGGNCGKAKNAYYNASGEEITEQKTNNTMLAHQTNAILIVASLFIATALIIKTK